MFSVVVTIFIVIISSMDSFTAKFWLKHWSEQNTEEGGNVNLAFYLGVYLGIGITFAVLGGPTGSSENLLWSHSFQETS